MTTLPEPPYFAVIFGSQRRDVDPEGYAATAARMTELAAQQPGCLGAISARGPDGFGITVSYWTSEAHIAAWREQVEHRLAREAGRARWYTHYTLEVARVERRYVWTASASPEPGGASGVAP
ncbi:MAG: antibiotic biosynthesis monooxygenase [Burkholderiaceae bacterium]|nr:antibiotic biosynthesis monooxygenase [Burkholderiaceae bacterium]